MPPESASPGYSGHRRYRPLFHFIAIPILGINLIVRIVMAVRHPEVMLFWWEIVVASGLVCLAFAARLMALAVQDRLIRLEETLRLERLLPADLRGRVGELSTGQLIAIRFCHDDDVPELTRAVLTEPIHKREAIKKRIRNWRPDLRPRA
jgi:hypothetical protein